MIMELITAPTRCYPFSLQELKAHLRIETGDDDPYLDSLAELATDCLDGPNGMLGGRCLVQQVWEFRLANWFHRHTDESFWPLSPLGDACRIEIPLSPVVSVASVKYLDMTEVEQTLAADQYVLITRGWEPAIIQSALGVTWPMVAYWRPDAIRIRCTVGYAAASGAGLTGKIPRNIIQCMFKAIGTAFENRDQAVDMYIDQTLLAPSRLPVVA